MGIIVHIGAEGWRAFLDRIVLLSLALLFIPVTASATTFYVDKTNPNARNNNQGTDPSQPWASLAKAASTVVAGDTVIVGPDGVYDERVFPSNSGSPGNPIVYIAASGTRPKVRGWSLANKHHIVVAGFEVTNAGMSPDVGMSFLVSGSDNIEVVNNYIHDTNAIAVRASIFDGGKATNLIVRNNTMAYIGLPGARVVIIQCYCSSTLIEGNDLSHGEDFVQTWGNHNVMRNNYTHDGVAADTAGNRHLDAYQSYCFSTASETMNYVLIENNVHVNNPSSNDHFVLNNQTDICGGSTTVIIRHNLVNLLGSAPFSMDLNHSGDYADNWKIYNNTVNNTSYNNGGAKGLHHVAVLNATRAATVLNNIFVDAIASSSPAQMYVFKTGDSTSRGDYNLAYMSNGNITWASPIASETHVLLNRDPMFVGSGDFRLQPGSPARGAGGALTTVAQTDSGGTTLLVVDSHFFQDGWAGVVPDQIAVGSSDNAAQISSIDYSTNTITLTSSIPRNPGDQVWLYKNSSGNSVLTSSAPDLGAFPYTEGAGSTYTISANAGANGVISPSGPASVPPGNNQIFTISAGNGYQVADVLVDGVSVGAHTSYAFTNVQANHTISARFGVAVAPTTHTITASTGPNGSISPSGTVSVAHGDSRSFTITPSPGFVIVSVLVDGSSVGSVTNYTFTNVTAPHTISVSFAVTTRNITAIAGLGGTISPSGTVVVGEGAAQTFTIKPNTNYRIVNVLVDGVPTGSLTSYTFTSVTAPHTIAATFEVNPGTVWTITANSGPNGSISPSGTVLAPHGTSHSFTITPAVGSSIADVLVDGVSMGSVSTLTLANVAGDHTIVAHFVLTYAIVLAPVPVQSQVSGLVRVTMDAFDDAQVSGVEFRVQAQNGSTKNLGFDTVAPWEVEWNTTTDPPGLYEVVALITDKQINSITANAQVLVSNPAESASVNVNRVVDVLDGATNPLPGSGLLVTEPNGLPVSVQGNLAASNPLSTLQGDTSAAAAAVAIIGFRKDGILVSEAGVPSSASRVSGRIAYEDTTYAPPSVRCPRTSQPPQPVCAMTGIALSNPSARTLEIRFYFSSTTGSDFGYGTLTLGPRAQRSQFLNEAPFNGPVSAKGSFTFTAVDPENNYAPTPIGVIGLRGLYNERDEFLITTLPVASLGNAITGNIVLPHFADGNGWSTQVVLTNPTNDLVSGVVQFYGQGLSGDSGLVQMTVSITDGRTLTGMNFDYSIPPRSSVRLVTSGLRAVTQAGSVRINPNGAGIAPSAVSIFSYKTNNITVSEASVSAQTLGTSYKLYMESAPSTTPATSIGAIQSGVAIANPEAAPVTVNLDLNRLDGSSTGLTTSVTVPAGGQISKLSSELFPELTEAFQGIIRLSAPSGIAVAALRVRWNERDELLMTTTPPLNEANAPAAEQLFPQVVSGGGWTTQIVAFGLTGPGRLYLHLQNGSLQPSATVSVRTVQ